MFERFHNDRPLSLGAGDRTELVKVLRPTRHKIGHFGDVPKCSTLQAAVKMKAKLR